MSTRSYGPEEAKKLDSLIAEGATVLQEIEDLQTGLKDTVKSMAEELNIKTSFINDAIKRAHKGDWQTHKAKYEEVEAILDITKRI